MPRVDKGTYLCHANKPLCNTHSRAHLPVDTIVEQQQRKHTCSSKEKSE